MKTVHIDKVADYERSNATKLNRCFSVENDEGALFAAAHEVDDDQQEGVEAILRGHLFQYRDGECRDETLRLLLVVAQNGKVDLLRRRHSGVKTSQITAALETLDGWLVAGINAAETQPQLDVDYPEPALLWFTVVPKSRWIKAGRPATLDTSC